jgi:hypothetical protein
MSKHINPFENWSLEDKKAFVQNEVEARQEYFDEYDKKQEEKRLRALEKANKPIKKAS